MRSIDQLLERFIFFSTLCPCHVVPLSVLFRKENLGCRFGSVQQIVSHLLYMDDLRVFGRSKEELESLIDTVRMFSKDIGMHFRLDKCPVLNLK